MKDKIQKIIDFQQHLRDEMFQFVNDKFPNFKYDDVRLEDTQIEAYVNLSCSCHPTMDWEVVSHESIFVDWLAEERSLDAFNNLIYELTDKGKA